MERLKTELHGTFPETATATIECRTHDEAITVIAMLGRLVREELQRLPEPPPHTICHTCQMHSGTPNLPIEGVYSCCVYCHFGTIGKEEARQRYPEDFAANDAAYAASETEEGYFERRGQRTLVD